MNRFPSKFTGHWILSLDPRLRMPGSEKSARPFFLHSAWVSVVFMFCIINPKEVSSIAHPHLKKYPNGNSFEETSG